MRLSDKDQNDSKTMNTYLHILEGYTNLYRGWKDAGLREKLVCLINIFINKIIRSNGQLGLFFGDDWTPHSTAVSCGHDIEASWLLDEAAEAEWSFIRSHLIRPDGEWYWSILPDGSSSTTDDIAGFWKYQYHNDRMCLRFSKEDSDISR